MDFNRNPTTGRMSVNLLLHLRSAPKKP